MTQAIFLSYASQDADAARGICDALRAAGLEVWFDQSELRGGDAWDASIRKQIKECALFVPMISLNTQAREEGYFRLEWKLAVDRSHLMADDKTFLLPVVIDDTPEPAARVPDKFRERQWSRLIDEKSIAAFAESVTKVFYGSASSSKSALNTPPVLESDGATKIAAVPQTPKMVPARDASAIDSRKRMGIYAGVAVTIIFFAVVAGLVYRPQFLTAQNDAINSVAVLPFVNESGDAGLDYVSDGLAETLIDKLSQVPSLSVRARASAFRFKAKSYDLPVIAKALNVQAILVGHLTSRTSNMGVTVELIDTRRDAVIFTKHYERPHAELAVLQALIGSDIVGRLSTDKSDALRARVAKIPTRDPHAYELYLRAVPLAQRRGVEDIKQAIAYLEQATVADPLFVQAHALLSLAYLRAVNQSTYPINLGLDNARRRARVALDLDADSAEGYAALSSILATHDWDWAGAGSAIERGLALSPSDVALLRNKSYLSIIKGDVDTAIASANKALEVNPVDDLASVYLGRALSNKGDFTAADKAFHRAAELNPSATGRRYYHGMNLIVQGRLDDVITLANSAEAAWERLTLLGIVHHLTGQDSESRAALAELTRKTPDNSAFQIAQIHAVRGESDEAFKWLERAYALRDAGMTLMKGIRVFGDLPKDPRWAAMLKKMHLEH